MSANVPSVRAEEIMKALCFFYAATDAIKAVFAQRGFL